MDWPTLNVIDPSPQLTELPKCFVWAFYQMDAWNMLSGFVQRSIWHVWSGWSTASSVLLFCPLKQAVYLLPVNQPPATPLFSSLLFTSLPLLSICFPAAFYGWCQAPHPLLYNPHHHNNHNHLMVVFVNGTVGMYVVKARFTTRSGGKTCALLFPG